MLRVVMSFLAAAAAAGPLVLAPVGPTAARPAHAQERPVGVSVVGEGRVVAAPDVARAVFGVERIEPSLGQALASASARMNQVIDRLVQLGIARDDIQTIRFSVEPLYDGRGESIVLRGFRVSNAVAATIRAVGSVGTIIDEAVAAGATRVEGVSFQTSRLGELKDQARVLAMANARAKAEQLAGLAGVPLGRVLSIEESDASGGPIERVAVTAAAPDRATPVEPGQLEIRTVVRVVWALG